MEEDFEFAWPDGTFASKKSASAAGLKVTQPLLGVYLDGGGGDLDRVVSDAVREHGGERGAAGRRALAAVGRPGGGYLVPTRLDVETASDAIEAYLG